MIWNGKNVLVTGAGGFIGSHLTEMLVKKGANVRAFLRYNSKNKAGFLDYLPDTVKENIEFFFGEIRELEAVQRALKNIDVVFNLAALIGIPYSYLHPQEVFNTNTKGILNILSAARNKSIDKIVHTSTSEVYGSALYIPIDEKHPLQPQSPYSASKIAADAVAMSFYYSFHTPVAIIRPFNTYGPRQSERAVIPTIITQAITKKSVKLGNTNTIRDFTFVEDTAEGFIKIAESDKSVGEIINIGSGSEISISDLCKKIAGLAGKDIVIETDEIRVRPKDSEVSRLLADNTRAKELADWKPKIGLEEGIKKTIEYIRENIHLYNPDKYIV
jgi:dTDP-glucose 4,6-dehydratase